ncbi:hypothetical protein N7468_003229 [Penicillium chermesinum]|uniref:Uncharacterized protein n=1 Tax=Penicillium chermesinum TaxID=63820 RepID=A0A9W9P6A2_9EURO|nr:uncharacterized protein N7468_003229 [Penicillium chermesinum]KAJ5238610.1 hypothetical protein N7468_003229 [Penicillium chermesinum]
MKSNFDSTSHSGPQGAHVVTPGSHSQASGSHRAPSDAGNQENDPFLSLLEQLAGNEHSQGGPSELDFFLTGAVSQEASMTLIGEKADTDST